ncbi:DUF481 domain-containing protein [Sphingomicrobium clamense]|uniref:DUF481 domain-containing protein n=1 Tax=Sphingomicrobium clamense TaxID=2851013 RepID=A0ABS6V7D1_9SPHN|nr:DUF481 domain-containing protein [Sphingomicrobium sp. B8]MBW0145476.1 DUF481 domain-containing protein [Sphingomicrobium sp. B8]
MFEMLAALALVQDEPQAPLPEGVRAMIEAAAETGDKPKLDTVLGIAREAYPDNLAEIDAIETEARANRRAIAARVEARRIEALLEASMFERWEGRGELGGFQSTGNSDSVGVSAGFALARNGIDWRHKLTGSADYQRSDGETDREIFSLAYEPQRDIGTRAFAFGLAGVERDRLQGIGWRTTLSGGVGWRVIESDNFALSLKAGPAWRRTNYIDAPNESSLSGLSGLSARWAITDTIALTEEAEAIVNGQSSYSSVTGLEARFSDHLLGRVSFEVDHESDPPAGAVETDTLTRITVVYDF